MSPILTYWLLGLFTLAVCVFAMAKGGRGERYGGGVILAMVVLERGLRAALGASAGSGTDLNLIISLIGDAATALLMLGLAVRFASPWLGAVMLFYAIQFGVHAFYLVAPESPDALRVVSIDMTFAGIHVALITGTVLAWRDRLRQGPPAPRLAGA